MQSDLLRPNADLSIVPDLMRTVDLSMSMYGEEDPEYHLSDTNLFGGATQKIDAATFEALRRGYDQLVLDRHMIFIGKHESRYFESLARSFCYMVTDLSEVNIAWSHAKSERLFA